MGAKSYSFTDIVCFARYIQTPPTSSGSDNDSRGDKFFSSGYRKNFFFSGMLHFFHFPMFEQIDRIMLKMGTQIIGKLTTCRVRNRNQIFDTHGFFHLASDTLGNDGYFQSFSGRIDGCRRACRTTSYDQDVVFLFRDFLAGILRTVGRLQFFKEFSEFSPSDVYELTVGIYRRHSLYMQSLYFGLIYRSVYHFVFYVVVQDSHQIQGLYNIRTIRTC